MILENSKQKNWLNLQQNKKSHKKLNFSKKVFLSPNLMLNFTCNLMQ